MCTCVHVHVCVRVCEFFNFFNLKKQNTLKADVYMSVCMYVEMIWFPGEGKNKKWG